MRIEQISLFVAVLSVSVLAQGGGGTPSTGFGASSFVPMMIVMFVVIYFFMIRPEQKKQKDKQQMMKDLKKGDKVLTIGGIYGVVGNLKENTVMLRIADSTSVEVARSAVSSVVDNEGK